MFILQCKVTNFDSHVSNVSLLAQQNNVVCVVFVCLRRRSAAEGIMFSGCPSVRAWYRLLVRCLTKHLWEFQLATKITFWGQEA